MFFFFFKYALDPLFPELGLSSSSQINGWFSIWAQSDTNKRWGRLSTDPPGLVSGVAEDSVACSLKILGKQSMDPAARRVQGNVALCLGICRLTASDSDAQPILLFLPKLINVFIHSHLWPEWHVILSALSYTGKVRSSLALRILQSVDESTRQWK